MSFKKEMEKFNRLVLKFEKDSMRVFKKLEALSITLDQKQEDYLGKSCFFRLFNNLTR